MGFSIANLNWRLLLAVILAAGVLPTGAQRMARGGQPILLSAPESDTDMTNAPSLMPKAPDQPDLTDTIRAPGLNFSSPFDNAQLPPPAARAASPPEADKMREKRDKNRNWAMMTPEQIMGIPTPEKIIGLAESDAFGNPLKKNVVDQRVERQHSRTNNFMVAAHAPTMDFFDRQILQWDPNSAKNSGGDFETPVTLELFAGNSRAKGGTPFDYQRPAAGWNPPSSPQASLSAEDRQAAEDLFQKLLEPRSPSFSAFKNEGKVKNNLMPSMAPESLLGKSQAYLIGTPVSSVSTGIGEPIRTAPLPGLLGQTNTPATPPNWKPDLPPWMSTAPRLGEVPQRKF